jgi:CheY-like chemotaxis protein
LIFEAFQQADGTTNRKYGGTGLGLTISREIARLLGGVIEIESDPGKGSTFRLRMPQKYLEPDADNEGENAVDLPKRQPVPRDVDFSGCKILVVDDDTRNIFALTSILQNRGFQVLSADNGKSAMEILDHDTGINLILMDIMMPEMDGLEASRKIRSNPKYRDLPIVSLTAKAMKGDREKCLDAGASDYVTKPVDEETLMSTIYYWITSSGSTDARAN